MTRPGPRLTVFCVAVALGYTGAAVGIYKSHEAAPTLPKIPGAVNPEVTQANIHQTICFRGWTATIRPPVSYTGALKRKLAREQGVNPHDFQLDHLVSLEVGGAPRSLDNLWLEPLGQAHRDDRMENQWREKVCSGELTLDEGRRQEIDWKESHG